LDDFDLPSSFTLYSQTTKSTDKFYAIKEELLSRGYEEKANDTICRQVSNRYDELGNFARQYDKVVFVSGKKSSNGRVLYDVCLKSNANSYFISDPAELQPALFNPGDRVGVCGATSTPMWLMEQVKAVLERY